MSFNQVREDKEDGTIYTYSEETMTKLTRLTILVIASSLLLVPIIILYFVRGGFRPLAVIIVWTIAFTALLGYLTDARNTEIMMAAAAYVVPPRLRYSDKEYYSPKVLQICCGYGRILRTALRMSLLLRLGRACVELISQQLYELFCQVSSTCKERLFQLFNWTFLHISIIDLPMRLNFVIVVGHFPFVVVASPRLPVDSPIETHPCTLPTETFRNEVKVEEYLITMFDLMKFYW